MSDAKLQQRTTPPAWALGGYLAIGVFFGVVLIKSEVVSWYRIQEMFRFQSFHMYGVLATAVLSSALVIALVKALRPQPLSGERLSLSPKPWGPGNRSRYAIGGTIFGLGWGLSGTCPGPIYALAGYGVGAAAVVLLSALLGARVYAALAKKLPH